MKNIIENNYYGILGILPSSSTKQIVKNTKEINRYLQIDEQPKYPFDFGLYGNRTEKQVKTASNEILNPKINIVHFFFRVFLDSEKEKDFVMDIEKNLSYNTIMDYYDKFDKSSLNVKKNTAIMLLILLTIKKNIEKRIREKQEEAYKKDIFLNFGKEHLKDVKSIVETSISLWKNILESEQYLNDFIKLYKFYDEIGIVEDIYKNLKENIKQELLYIYSDVSNTFMSGEYILNKYITEFNLQNTNLNLKQIDNIYIEIDKQISILKKMNISEDGIFDEQEKKTLDDFFSTVRFELNKLKEFGFYESSKTKILRDSIAKTVRIHSVDLFNNLQDTNAAIDLLDFCIEVAATENLKISLLNDKKIINNSLTYIASCSINEYRDIKIFTDKFIIDGEIVNYEDVEYTSFRTSRDYRDIKGDNYSIVTASILIYTKTKNYVFNSVIRSWKEEVVFLGDSIWKELDVTKLESYKAFSIIYSALKDFIEPKVANKFFNKLINNEIVLFKKDDLENILIMKGNCCYIGKRQILFENLSLSEFSEIEGFSLMEGKKVVLKVLKTSYHFGVLYKLLEKCISERHKLKASDRNVLLKVKNRKNIKWGLSISEYTNIEEFILENKTNIKNKDKNIKEKLSENKTNTRNNKKSKIFGYLILGLILLAVFSYFWTNYYKKIAYDLCVQVNAPKGINESIEEFDTERDSLDNQLNRVIYKLNFLHVYPDSKIKSKIQQEYDENKKKDFDGIINMRLYTSSKNNEEFFNTYDFMISKFVNKYCNKNIDYFKSIFNEEMERRKEISILNMKKYFTENKKESFANERSFALKNFFNDDIYKLNETLNSRLEKQTFGTKKVSLPKTGLVKVYSKKKRVAPLKILTIKDPLQIFESYFFKLYDYDTNKEVLSFFIRTGEDLEVKVPLGSYVLKYVSGTTWYGEKYLFGYPSDYFVFSQVLDFSEGYGYYEGHTITMYKQKNGTLSTKSISEESF